MKKRTIALFCLLFVQVLLCSCSENKEGQSNENLATPWQAEKTEEPVKEGEKKPISEADAFTAAEKYLKQMSLEQKIGQLFFVNLELLDESKGSYENFTKITKKMKSSMKKYPIGGVVLMSKNIETKDQIMRLVNDLQSASDEVPLYIATEEAGGKRSVFANNENLRCTVLPSYRELGQTKMPEELLEAARTMGSELKGLGFNLNLAPVADIADEIKNPSYADNCFSDDKDITSKMVKNMVTGLRQSGVGTVLKHFPGIGSVPGRIGQEFVNDDISLMHMRENDFIPFQAGISVGTDMILVTNAAVTKITQNTVPACMSELIIEGILRDELGFDGIIITDALNVPIITSNYTSDKAVLQALAAGTDMILMPEDLEKSFKAVKEAVIDHSFDMKVLNAAVFRIIQNKIKQGILTLEE